jgi:hypothetical protein
MPDSVYGYCYISGDSGTYYTYDSSSPTWASYSRQVEQSQEERKKLYDDLAQAMREWEKRIEEEKQHKKDMKKYPLFFWKETCKKGD